MLTYTTSILIYVHTHIYILTYWERLEVSGTADINVPETGVRGAASITQEKPFLQEAV